MPFFPKAKAIYIHIPKAGGSSVESALALQEDCTTWPPHRRDEKSHKMYLYGPSTSLDSFPTPSIKHHSLQHSTWVELECLLAGKDLSDFTLVTSLRDPFAKIVSEVKFQMTHFSIFPGIPSFKLMARGPFETFRKTFNQIVRHKLDAFKTNPHLDDNHWLPQVEFLKNKDGSINSSIHCVLLSSLQAGFQEIFGPTFVLPHNQKSNRIHPGHSSLELFDEDLIKEIQEIYSEDFRFIADLP